MSESINVENKKQNHLKPPRSVIRIAGEILAGSAAGFAVALPALFAFSIADSFQGRFGGIFVLWTVFSMFAPDFIYRTQSKWLPIPRETFNVIIYSFLGLVKVVFFFFNLTPYVALLIIA